MTERTPRTEDPWCARVAKESNFVDGPNGTIEGQIAAAILALTDEEAETPNCALRGGCIMKLGQCKAVGYCLNDIALA